jgi:hypothetical protein
MKRRHRRSGFLTIARVSFDLVDELVPELGTRYVFFRLVSFVDERDADDDGLGVLALSGRELAKMMHVPESTFRDNRKMLEEVGLLVMRTEYPGQLTIPGFGWHTAWEGAIDPPCAARARRVRGTPRSTPSPTSGNEPLDIRDVRDVSSLLLPNSHRTKRDAVARDSRTYDEQRRFFDAQIEAEEQERQRGEEQSETRRVPSAFIYAVLSEEST